MNESCRARVVLLSDRHSCITWFVSIYAYIIAGEEHNRWFYFASFSNTY